MEKIDSLVQEMLAAMRRRGHEPELRLKQERSWHPGNIAIAKCRQCGLDADARDKPQPNEIEISGPAVALCCQPVVVKYDHVHVILDDGTDIEIGINQSIAAELQNPALCWSAIVEKLMEWCWPTEVDPARIVKVRLAG